MYGTTAAFALMWALMFPAMQDAPAPQQAPQQAAAVQQAQTPEQATQAAISYQAAVDGDWGESDAEAAPARVSNAVFEHGDPRWSARVTLYHHGGGGATGNDSLGCRPVPYRTIAVDPRQITRRTRVFIPETVGVRLPNGQTHDGYWYATDTGGAIRGSKVDFYTGHGRGSMAPMMRFNTRNVRLADAGRFQGCPPSWDAQPSQYAAADTTALGSR